MIEPNPYEAPQEELRPASNATPLKPTSRFSAPWVAFFCQVLTPGLWAVSARSSGFAAYAWLISVVFVLLTLEMIIYAIRIYSRNLLIIEIILLMVGILVILVLLMARYMHRFNENPIF